MNQSTLLLYDTIMQYFILFTHVELYYSFCKFIVLFIFLQKVNFFLFVLYGVQKMQIYKNFFDLLSKLSKNNNLFTSSDLNIDVDVHTIQEVQSFLHLLEAFSLGQHVPPTFRSGHVRRTNLIARKIINVSASNHFVIFLMSQLFLVTVGSIVKIMFYS